MDLFTTLKHNGDHEAAIQSKEWSWATNPYNWYDKQELRRVIAIEGIDDHPHLREDPNRPKRIPVAPDTVTSGPGTLSSLPADIVFQVINYLDVLTAEKLGQTCRAARCLLEQHPIYRTLQHVVPSLHKRYKICGLSSGNSLEELLAELHYPYCRTCSHHGTELYLPLGERVCHNCVSRNQAFWCIAVPDAMDIFCLSESQVRQLPIMRVREKHYVPFDFPNTETVERQDLVPAKAAFLTAISIWGNRETMCRYASSNDPGQRLSAPAQEKWLGNAYRYLRDMEVQTSDDPTQLGSPVQLQLPPHVLRTCTVPFPWLPKGKEQIERRFLCRGCEWLKEYPDVSIEMLEYSGINPNLPAKRLKCMIAGRMDRAYLWRELLRHVRCCAGAGFLMRRHVVERELQFGFKLKEVAPEGDQTGQ